MNVGDPVHVQVSNGQLEGVVAHLGPVQFTEGVDWIGVRLTGTSVSKGKNDGSVKGVKYFETADVHGGVFVRESSVSKRKLTRLEELRLKRELKAGGTAAPGISSSSSGGASVSNKTNTSKAITTPKVKSRANSPVPKYFSSGLSSASATSKAPDSVAKSGGRRRLDELREKRAAAAAAKPRSPVPPAAAATMGASSINSKSKNSLTTPPLRVASKTTEYEDNVSKIVSTSSPAERLEEMKQKRANSAALLPSTNNAGAAGASSAAVMKKYTTLLAKYDEMEKENQSLRQGIYQAEQIAEEKNEKVKNLMKINEALSKPTEDQVVQEESVQIDSTEIDEARQQVKRLEGDLVTLRSEKDAMENRLNETLDSLQEEINEERQSRQTEMSSLSESLAEANKKVAILGSQASAVADQAASRATSDAVSYKERAHLQAEVSSLTRRVAELEASGQETETALEELALDKEQLLEEKEILEEKAEELNLDLEAFKMELEEAKLDLEDAKAQSDSFGGRMLSLDDDMSGKAGTGTGADADDVVKSVSLQNSRLREAILRLREQSNVEKMDLSRKLRVAEKYAESGRELVAEVETLRTRKASLEAQNRDLQETVDVGSAFEGMVEDLSDRIISLEDDNAGLRQSINDLEEAAELAAEMEEVQADEAKALMKDLESRDTKIINLEEAIKMQRNREDDFQRTISNFRKSIETLKEEKASLLSMVEGGEGEKSELIVASQKALAQAAAFVDNASKMKKMEASAMINNLVTESRGLLAERFEELLPETFEDNVAETKLEILLSSISSKAFASVKYIKDIFTTTSERGEHDSGDNTNSKVSLSNMLHHSKLALVASKIGFKAQTILIEILTANDAEGNARRTLLAKQAQQTLKESDNCLRVALQMLLEDGLIEPHLTSVEQSLGRIESIDLSDGVDLLPGWKWTEFAALIDVSLRGSVAIVSSAESNEAEKFSVLLVKLKDALSFSCKLTAGVLPAEKCKEISEIQSLGEKILSTLTTVMVGDVVDNDAVKEMENMVDSIFAQLKDLCQFSLLPAVDGSASGNYLTSFVGNDDYSWEKVIKCIQNFYQDQELSFQLRADEVRERIAKAIESEANLDDYKNKLDETRKTLAARSVELSMQNKRIFELDKLLKQSSSEKDTVQIKEGSSAKLEMKEKENQMLTEAMEVLQSQVDEYESTIRALKDQPKTTKTPTKRSSTRRSSTHNMNLNVSDIFESSVSMEAALFRPALSEALSEASHWRSVAARDTVLGLAPLPSLSLVRSDTYNSPRSAQPQEGTDPGNDSSICLKSDVSQRMRELALASAAVQSAKASIECVDLSKGNCRGKLREQKKSVSIASHRFEVAYGEATSSLRQLVGLGQMPRT